MPCLPSPYLTGHDSFFYPEVKNLSLEQVDRLFTGEKVLLHWKPSMGERQGSLATGATPPVGSEIANEKMAVAGARHSE